MKQGLRLISTCAIVAGALFAGHWLWTNYTQTPWTREGRVRADVVAVASDVSGWVTHLDVADNQHVKAGQLLFGVDRERYQAAVHELEAKAAAARERWQLAQAQYRRRAPLEAEIALSHEAVDNAKREAALARAEYNVANATLQTAMLDLERTNVRSPVDGTVTNIGLRRGNFVTRGAPLLSIVQDDTFYVTAYFEETKLPYVHTGQRARMNLLGGSTPFEGVVTAISKGVANGNTLPDGQMLPKVQQAYTWVRLAQRIPVDIRLEHIPEGTVLSSGMTVSVELMTAGDESAAH